NALGTAQEKSAGRSTMSLLHAWFCVGTLSGALLGSLLAGLSITPLVHFLATSLLLLPPLTLAYRPLPPDRVEPEPGHALSAIAHGPVIALGLIGFCGAVAEGSIADWSGVFMT